MPEQNENHDSDAWLDRFKQSWERSEWRFDRQFQSIEENFQTVFRYFDKIYGSLDRLDAMARETREILSRMEAQLLKSRTGDDLGAALR